MKLIIFGASGSGTTTLGKTLGRELGWKHLDADDYYWAKTDPPFQHKLALLERNTQLWTAFISEPHVIISGSLVTWGSEWEKAFDVGVFLHIPPQLRMERLRKRELERYGDQLEKSSKAKESSEAFLEWAKKYDDPSFEGRSITQHENWIKRMSFPVLKLIGDIPTKKRIGFLKNQLEEFSPKP